MELLARSLFKDKEFFSCSRADERRTQQFLPLTRPDSCWSHRFAACLGVYLQP